MPGVVDRPISRKGSECRARKAGYAAQSTWWSALSSCCSRSAGCIRSSPRRERREPQGCDSDQRQVLKQGCEVTEGMRRLIRDGPVGGRNHQGEDNPVKERDAQQTHPAVMLEAFVISPHANTYRNSDAAGESANLRETARRSLPDL